MHLNLNYKRIGFHLLFWITLYLFFGISVYISSGYNIKMFFLGIFSVPQDLICVYFTLYYLLPVYFKKGKYLKFVAFVSITIISVVFIIAIPIEYQLLQVFYEDIVVPGYKDFLKNRFAVNLIVETMIVGFALSIKIGKEWISSSKKRQHLEKQKLEIEIKLKEAELNFLKSQINPHFLFNAINNLYGLTRKKSNKAPDVLLKISSLLDYMLYDIKNSKIDLGKEIENIRNYIDIQRLRYDNEVEINFKVKGRFKNVYIAPLLLMPLIENCFKHGLDENIGKAIINIEISFNKGLLSLITENSVAKQKKQISENSGIGHENLKKRLELEYKGKYSFLIKEIEETYKVELILNL